MNIREHLSKTISQYFFFFFSFPLPRRQRSRFSPFPFRSAYTFSASKSMMSWINLSPLCVALTRQSSDFMADWISVIKDDKQNHLLVISICHGTAFAISRTSLKNISDWWGAGRVRTLDAWERLRGEVTSADAPRCWRGARSSEGGKQLVNEEALKRDGGGAEVKNNKQSWLPGGISGPTRRWCPVLLVPTMPLR